MRSLAALALRLALRTNRAGRHRALMVTIASAIGTTVPLVVLAFAHADRVVHPERYGDDGLGALVALILVVIGVQVAALAAAAGRLSAVERTRRLANLRLLGLSAARTRLVSAIEVGAFAAAGSIAGVAAFFTIRPLLARVSVGGQRWPLASLHPGGATILAVAVASIAATVGLAVLPDRLDAASAQQHARRASTRSPSWWRLAPLVVGIGLCLYVRLRGPQNPAVGALLIGLAALGVGVMTVLPVFVRLSAAVFARLGRGPVGLVVGRRLHDQPARMSRVVTGLLVGLFAVTFAQSIVTSFELTPQYRGALIGVRDHQSVVAWAPAEATASLVASARGVPGVRDAVALGELHLDSCADEQWDLCLVGVVATCDELAAVLPSMTGCRPDEAQWLHAPGSFAPQADVTGRRWVADDADARSAPGGRVTSSITVDEVEPFGQVAQIKLPPSAPGIAALAASAPHRVLVVGDPGRDLPERLAAAGIDDVYSPWDVADYDFVAAVRTLAQAVAGAVLGLGLLAFAIAAIDQAANRRRDVAGLLLLGTPAAALRRVQWVEAAVPIIGGGVLAIGLGLLGGATALAVSDQVSAPIGSAAWLILAAAVGGAFVAALTVLAATPAISDRDLRSA